jgi:hypothetical protein
VRAFRRRADVEESDRLDPLPDLIPAFAGMSGATSNPAR